MPDRDNQGRDMGVIFSSNRSLIIARKFGDNCIQFYLMQLDDLGEIAKKYNLSKYEVNYIDGNRVYFWDKKNCLLILGLNKEESFKYV